MYARRTNATKSNVAGWLFGSLLIAVGLANLLVVHPVPAIAYALVALIYLPPAGAVLKRRFGVSIHPLAKVACAIAILAFTLGVSDLGDMLD